MLSLDAFSRPAVLLLRRLDGASCELTPLDSFMAKAAGRGGGDSIRNIVLEKFAGKKITWGKITTATLNNFFTLFSF